LAINKITFLFCILLTILISRNIHTFAENTPVIDISGALSKAHEFYCQRENINRLKSAIKLYKKILGQLHNSGETSCKITSEIHTELSKCYFKMASYHLQTNNAKALFYKTGEKHGKKAIAKNPENVGGYYWMVQNLGQHGSINKLYFLNRKGEFEKALEKAETLDNPNEPYDYSGIYRTLAAYYTPRFLWGNMDKALDYAKKMEDDTHYLCNLVILAEIYEKIDKDKSQEYINRIIKANVAQFPETQFENTIEQQEVIQKWGGARQSIKN
jgi:tetratricopeptide (TPR) repeat protein